MLSFIKNSIYKIPEAIGLELRFQQDGSYTLALLHLKKEKDLLEVVKYVSDCGTIEHCMPHIPAGMPVLLAFAGKGIICKKVSVPEAGIEAAVATLVPNAQLEEFAYDTFIDGGQAYVALVRKAKLEPILQKLLQLKVAVVGLTLEFMPLLRFQALLGLEQMEMNVQGYKIMYADNAISDFALSAAAADDLKVGTAYIQAPQVLPYVVAFGAILSPLEHINSNVSEVGELHAEFLEKKLFKTSWVSALVILLLILVVNALVFTGQFSKNENLKQQSYQFKGKNDDLKKEELALLEKEKFLEQNGWLHKSTLSFMCDKLAATVPSSISLRDLSINPIYVEQGSVNKKTYFLDKKLNIRGKCYKSSDLSNWIQILKNLNWISDVQMVDYLHDHNHNSAVFNLEITYNIE